MDVNAFQTTSWDVVFLHNEHNKAGGFPWGLMVGHIRNESDQKSKGGEA